MLVNKEEMEELVVRPCDGHEPGRRQREVEHNARRQVKAPPEGPIAGEHRIDDESATRQHDADQSLRQRRPGERGRGNPHPRPAGVRAGFRALGDEQRGKAQRQEEGEPGIESENLADAGVPECRGEHERRVGAERARHPRHIPRRRSRVRRGIRQSRATGALPTRGRRRCERRQR